MVSSCPVAAHPSFVALFAKLQQVRITFGLRKIPFTMECSDVSLNGALQLVSPSQIHSFDSPRPCQRSISRRHCFPRRSDGMGLAIFAKAQPRNCEIER